MNLDGFTHFTNTRPQPRPTMMDYRPYNDFDLTTLTTDTLLDQHYHLLSELCTACMLNPVQDALLNSIADANKVALPLYARLITADWTNDPDPLKQCKCHDSIHALRLPHYLTLSLPELLLQF